MLVHQGKCYAFTLASDLERDGMYLELRDTTTPRCAEILSAFYSDVNGETTFTAFRDNLPLEVVEAFIEEAKRLLMPVQRLED